jgi:hypothetical protein
MRLPFFGHGTASGGLFISCCKCRQAKRYSDAASAGWYVDLAGKPYKDYFCEKCVVVRIRVRSGSYCWDRADGAPGSDYLEMGQLETMAVPMDDGLYSVTLPDGKRVYVKGDEI